MAVYWFVAKDKDANGNPLPPVPAGHPERFVFVHPDPDAKNVIAWVQQQGIGSPNRSYSVWRLDGLQLLDPLLLCVQPSYGHAGQPNAQHPVTSPAHVQGGQPAGMPHSQPGQNRETGERDRIGFQPLGDAALPAGGDAFFGDVPDMGGTFTDLVGGGKHEVPRQ